MRYEGKRGEIEKLVLEIVKDVSGEQDLSELNYEEKLRDQLDIDSMDFLDIVMELRKKYRVDIPKEDYLRLATLEGCVDYLSPKFSEDFKYLPSN